MSAAMMILRVVVCVCGWMADSDSVPASETLGSSRRQDVSKEKGAGLCCLVVGCWLLVTGSTGITNNQSP